MQHKIKLLNKLEEYRIAYQNCVNGINCDSSGQIIHKSRVSIRRLMSINCFIDLLVGDGYYLEIKKELRKNIKYLNPLRDTQVQIKIVGNAIERGEMIEEFYLFLLYKEKKILQSQLKNTIFDKFNRFGTLLIWQKQFIDSFVSDEMFSNSNIIRAFEDIEKEIQIRIVAVDKSNEESIHNLRLIIKKYRYMIEVVSNLFPDNGIDIQILKKLQTSMGKIQDLHIIIEVLNKYIQNNTENINTNLTNFRDSLIVDKQYKINLLTSKLAEYKNLKIENYFKKMEYF